MKKIKISNHPFIAEVGRKLAFGVLSIDYEKSIAKWPFDIIHYDDSDVKIAKYIPNVSGMFTISNQRNVDPTTGQKIPFPDPVMDENGNSVTPTIGGMPEFDFLNAMLLLKDVSPLLLGTQRALIADARGIFNDYDNLMNL
jgi:hypothetical protein